MRIAVLMTCHNRREKTVAALHALKACDFPQGFHVDVFLVDDGSTDGTEQDVKAMFPEVRLSRGDGSLFWNRGMHLAFETALRENYDGYLWLNDDTIVYRDAFTRIFEGGKLVPAKDDGLFILIGSTRNPATQELTYGGVVGSSSLLPFRYEPVPPSKDRLLPCDTMNGNFVFIPAAAARRVGNLDPVYEHAMGDTDYGLRARRLGVRLYVLPGFVGECGRNPAAGGFRDKSLPLSVRWRRIRQPKGLPFRSWLHFTRRHGGRLWPLYFLWPYLKVVMGR